MPRHLKSSAELRLALLRRDHPLLFDLWASGVCTLDEAEIEVMRRLAEQPTDTERTEP